MTNAPSVSSECAAKVVLVGSSGVGKAAIVKAMAKKYAHSAVRAGEIGEGKVFRTEFFWPEPLHDGGRLFVRLFGISGNPVYNAVEELVLANADGVVFVANLAHDEGPAVRAALRAMVLNGQHSGIDFTSMPAALHYHLGACVPAFEPNEMDEWLGIPTGSVPRFVTGPEGNGELRSPAEWIIAQIANRSDHPAAPSKGG